MEATTSVADGADMERLMPQIKDPRQHDQFLKTLQGLILAVKQPRDDLPLQEMPSLFTDQSQAMFFAFGELTQYLGMLGRRISHRFAAIPT